MQKLSYTTAFLNLYRTKTTLHHHHYPQQSTPSSSFTKPSATCSSEPSQKPGRSSSDKVKPIAFLAHMVMLASIHLAPDYRHNIPPEHVPRLPNLFAAGSSCQARQQRPRPVEEPELVLPAPPGPWASSPGIPQSACPGCCHA
ncbi:hypothetical protein BVRB_8g193820 [Beta vulgaris subsp. vulgaris]|nr:hypothetical protein BVRB_8g193820 [Beta vulgaris subsp. vulgaris]